MKRVALVALATCLLLTAVGAFADVAVHSRDNSNYGQGPNFTAGSPCSFSNSTASTPLCTAFTDSVTNDTAYALEFDSATSNVQITFSGLTSGTNSFGLLVCSAFSSSIPCLDSGFYSLGDFGQGAAYTTSDQTLVFNIHNFAPDSGHACAPSTPNCNSAVFIVEPALDINGGQAVPDITIGNIAGSAVPEPSSLILLCSGAIGLLGRLRRRK